MKRLLLAIALFAFTSSLAPAGAGTRLQRATPEIRRFESIEATPGEPAWMLREADPSAANPLGLVLVCRPTGVEAQTYLGFFPPDRRPVQLAVRKPDGTVERFGSVFTAGPEAGFNDTLLTDPGTVRRFAEAALQNGSLVSNGYNSFWNRIPETENRRVIQALRACGL